MRRPGWDEFYGRWHIRAVAIWHAHTMLTKRSGGRTQLSDTSTAAGHECERRSVSTCAQSTTPHHDLLGPWNRSTMAVGGLGEEDSTRRCPAARVGDKGFSRPYVISGIRTFGSAGRLSAVVGVRRKLSIQLSIYVTRLGVIQRDPKRWKVELSWLNVTRCDSTRPG